MQDFLILMIVFVNNIAMYCTASVISKWGTFTLFLYIFILISVFLGNFITSDVKT